ncbi:HAD family phosphatase [Arsenicicoccus piscis]|nr:HAD family phosphatase [Arsenicicoccus piscis]MCH8629286.1 HAD family phosphatase [Arsenicicoccus piscis]
MTTASAPPQPLPSALLLDMDGTLVDSEPYWMAEEFALVESYGGVWSHEDAQSIVGRPLTYSASVIREHTGMPLTIDEIVQRLLGGVVERFRQHAPWRPGAKELLDQAQELGVPCALVTMSYTVFANELEKIVPAGTFSAVVTGDTVTHGKPHPEPYLTACARLGVEPRTALAIEDSPSGMRSAVAAHVPTIAVPHVVPVPHEHGAAQVPTLAGRSLADLWATATA